MKSSSTMAGERRLRGTGGLRTGPGSGRTLLRGGRFGVRVAWPAGRRGAAIPNVLAWPLVAFAVVGVVWMAYWIGVGQAGAAQFRSQPRIDDVRRIARLAVLRVRVADIIDGENAGGRAAILVKGDADVAIDFDRIQIAERDEGRKRLVIAMPLPRVERPRVDHEATRVFELRKTGLAAINPFADPRADLLHDAMRAAQEAVERGARDPALVTQAQRHAEQLLAAFFAEPGWAVETRWVEAAGTGAEAGGGE